MDALYGKALNRLKKNNQSLHNKVFDWSKGKFVDIAEYTTNNELSRHGNGKLHHRTEESTVMVHDANLFVEKGN